MTSTESTESRLAAIKERLSASTPGPWELEVEDDWRATVYLNPNHGVYPAQHRPIERDLDFGVDSQRDEALATADLIANAPSDITFLLAEVAALQARAEAAEAEVARQSAAWQEAEREHAKVIHQISTECALHAGNNLKLRERIAALLSPPSTPPDHTEEA